MQSSEGGTKTPVDVPYVMPGSDQPYKFSFQARVFNPAKIQSVKSVSDKDEFKVTLSDDDRQAEVSIVVAQAQAKLPVTLRGQDQQVEVNISVRQTQTVCDHGDHAMSR